jgi:tetratricopeptide (TPR) repeat protein
VARLEQAVALEGFFAQTDVAPERARALLAALLLLGLAAPAAEATPAVPLELVATAAAPAPASASSAHRSDPAEARARRHRLLQQAIRNMGIGPFADRPPPPRSPEPATTPLPAAAPPPAAGSAEAALRDSLLAIAPRAKEPDLFARLGLGPAATRDDVKAAFLKLARQFHPDRFAAPGLADLAGEVRDFFAAVNEAYDVLSNEKKRAAYVATLSGAASAHGEAARVDFQKGEACLRTRDWARARGFYESAVRADPRPEYQAALAFACFVDPARCDADRAHELLEKAMKDPKCDRAFYVAGIVARDEKDEAAAERLFRAAVQANPRNVDAVRELRLLEARRSDRRR